MSRLREARDKFGLGREKVAARIGVTSKTIERWEKGQPQPRRYRLMQLAELYEVPVSELLEEDKT